MLSVESWVAGTQGALFYVECNLILIITTDVETESEYLYIDNLPKSLSQLHSSDLSHVRIVDSKVVIFLSSR